MSVEFQLLVLMRPFWPLAVHDATTQCGGAGDGDRERACGSAANPRVVTRREVVEEEGAVDGWRRAKQISYPNSLDL